MEKVWRDIFHSDDNFPSRSIHDAQNQRPNTLSICSDLNLTLATLHTRLSAELSLSGRIDMSEEINTSETMSLACG